MKSTSSACCRQLGRPQSPPGWLLAIPVICVLLGCSPEPQRVGNRATSVRTATSNHLSKAIDFLKRLNEFEKSQAILRATYQTNRWIGEQSPPEDWEPDPLIQTLPRTIRDGPEISRLEQLQFSIEDMDPLVEAVWMRDISQWVSSRPDPSPLATDISRQAAELGGAAGDQLVVAARLFDWTIRNIELAELLEYPMAPVTVGTESAQAAAIPPPKRRLPGPGYQLQPWQALLYGHGDSLIRGRIFIHLARQEGIPVVMLAFPGQTTPPRPRPWLTAALIGQELYLFDTEFGIPIPGPAGRPIATLSEVLDDPTLLEALAVGDEFPYEVAARDLNSIMALIDASASALSLKAHLVSQNLSGGDRLRLTVDPSKLRDRLQDCRGIEEVNLWALPFEADWYQAAIAAALKVDKSLDTEQYLKYGVFQARTALVRARYAHFRGDFENEGEQQGAKTLYLESRMSNKRIDQIETSEEVQEFFGVNREQGESDLSFKNRIAGTQLMVTQTKLHASYWLGLAQYDSGHPAASAEWLERTQEIATDDTWSTGIRYNRGRAYEALGQVQQARELYLSDDSPQQHGNILRARLLRPYSDSERQ